MPKINKIAVFYVEPTKYSVYTAENFHLPQGSAVYYRYTRTEHNNDVRRKGTIFMDKMSFIKMLKLIFKTWRTTDLIICNGYSYNYFIVPFLLNFMSRKKVVLAIESDTMFSDKKRKGIKGKLKTIIKQLIFSNKCVFGLSGGSLLHRAYFTKNGMPDTRVFLAPMISVPYNEEVDFEKKKLKNDFTFLFVGRLVHIKNIPLLISAFVKTFPNSVGVKLKIVGKGPLKDELKSSCKDIDNIEFVGAKFGEALEKEYLDADVLVLPSFSDQWGLVINEALSYGLPVIASEGVGAAHDLIKTPQTGIVFKNNSLEDLSTSMLSLYENPIMTLELAKKSYFFMKDNWNLNYYKNNINNFIHEIEKSN